MPERSSLASSTNSASVFRLAADELRKREADWTPLPYQVPPDFDSGDWLYFVLCGGRGIGKTDTGAYAFDRYMVDHPGARGRIIAPTQGDAYESCVKGPSGIPVHNPEVRFNANERALYWPNGSRARLFGAYTPEDVQRLRANTNSNLDWYEEFAAWVKLDEAFDQARFGLRRGAMPRTIVTTTPQNKPRMRWLLGKSVPEHPEYGDNPPVILRHATTRDNPHLSEQVRNDFFTRYGGFRLGLQELEGQLLEDVPGALWQPAELERQRLLKTRWSELPEFSTIVVGVDPTGGSAECGIVVAGLGTDGRGYVLADLSVAGSPQTWVRAIVDGYHAYNADRVIVETNFGGDMVAALIRTEDHNVPIREAHASRGKQLRAQPVANLYEQGRVSHVDLFGRLEDQMTTWVPDAGMPSPDRLDALVWALTDLMLGRGGNSRSESFAVVGRRVVG